MKEFAHPGGLTITVIFGNDQYCYFRVAAAWTWVFIFIHNFFKTFFFQDLTNKPSNFDCQKSFKPLRQGFSNFGGQGPLSIMTFSPYGGGDFFQGPRL